MQLRWFSLHSRFIRLLLSVLKIQQKGYIPRWSSHVLRFQLLDCLLRLPKEARLCSISHLRRAVPIQRFTRFYFLDLPVRDCQLRFCHGLVPIHYDVNAHLPKHLCLERTQWQNWSLRVFYDLRGCSIRCIYPFGNYIERNKRLTSP